MGLTDFSPILRLLQTFDISFALGAFSFNIFALIWIPFNSFAYSWLKQNGLCPG